MLTQKSLERVADGIQCLVPEENPEILSVFIIGAMWGMATSSSVVRNPLMDQLAIDIDKAFAILDRRVPGTLELLTNRDAAAKEYMKDFNPPDHPELEEE